MSDRSPFGNLPSEIYGAGMSEKFFSDKEARAEYARLRKIANRRIARMEKAGYGNSRVMKRFGGGFQSMRGAKIEDVREQLGDVAYFFERKTSSVTGQRAARRKFIETMHELGYDFINSENAGRFGDFMEAAKQHYGNRNAFDSNQISIS